MRRDRERMSEKRRESESVSVRRRWKNFAEGEILPREDFHRK